MEIRAKLLTTHRVIAKVLHKNQQVRAVNINKIYFWRADIGLVIQLRVVTRLSLVKIKADRHLAVCGILSAYFAIIQRGSVLSSNSSVKRDISSIIPVPSPTLSIPTERKGRCKRSPRNLTVNPSGNDGNFMSPTTSERDDSAKPLFSILLIFTGPISLVFLTCVPPRVENQFLHTNHSNITTLAVVEPTSFGPNPD